MNLGEGGLILLRRWDRPGLSTWLGLDLLGPDIIQDLPDPLHPGSDLVGAVLLAGDFSPAYVSAGRTLLLSEGLLWSLIDPLDAGRSLDAVPAERHEIERALRAERRRFAGAMVWWRQQGMAEGGALRGLLRGFTPDLTVLLDVLDQAGARVNPPPGAQEGPVPVAGKTPDPLPHLVPEAVQAWLGSDSGLGAVYGAGFGARDEQADMARQVTEALVARRPLLVESGTGVGKTLAYLVPLLAAVRQEDVRAVISTHTRTLQSQILDQDLPRMQPLLQDLKCALLMGRRNYLCLRQRQDFLTRSLESLQDSLQTMAFRMWLRATREGMREELVGHPLLDEVLPRIFDVAEPCIPGQCYEGGECFVQAARRRARSADLLIVNHSLLMHDLKAERTLIGEYDFLVVDEAHRLPQVALDSHGLACGRWRMEDIGELLGGWGQGLPGRCALLEGRLRQLDPGSAGAADAVAVFGRVVQECRPLFANWWSAVTADLSDLLASAGNGQWRIRIRDKAESLRGSLVVVGGLLEKLAEASAACSRFAGLANGIEELPAMVQDDLAQVAQACQLLDRLQEDIHFLVRDPDDRWVTWAEATPRGPLKILGATLVESGELLREYWLENGLSPVMTSATLAVGEDFTHMLRELGLTNRRPSTLTHTTPSPFDYHRQVLVLTPSHFLPPDAVGFGGEVGEVLATLMRDIGRKTMGLFTSYRHLAEAGRMLQEAGITPPGPGRAVGAATLLQQTPGVSAAPLMSAFRAYRRAVLLGTSSFWEGVDFPGADLEILVVAKLPFLVPADPWVQARCEQVAARGDNPFTDFMVRDAVLRLKQGFGRLIRRHRDRGVVIILDTRLHTKNYGATFLASMPVMPRSFGDQQEMVERVREFFQQADAELKEKP